MADSAETIEKMYGPTVIMDRYGKKKLKQARGRPGRKAQARATEESQKQAPRATPPGRPLERWGDREVIITPEDVAQAILEFNERVPEAAGLLDPRGE